MTRDARTLCVVCAWRATCQKKFSMSGTELHCPDFTRDLTLPKENDAEQKKEHEERNSQDS